MDENKQCFVIMPISDPKDYETGHFKCVYEDIFIPAIKDAGYIPKRADDDKSSSMIQVNIIQDIIDSPMAICDLSSKNPNVLFELGIRQAFDLPVVLVQEEGTPRIFDISTINTIDYGKELSYRNVINDRVKIKEAILQTRDNNKGINSIVKLLGREPAKNKEGIDDNALLFAMSNQIQNILNKIENMNVKEKQIKASQENVAEYPVNSKKAMIEYQLRNLKSRYLQVSTVEDRTSLLNELNLMKQIILSSELFDYEESQIEIDAINHMIGYISQHK